MSEQGDAQVRDDVRRWIAEHWDPEMPLEKWWAELAESGWAFPDHPTDWFGRGLPGDSRRIVREELDVAGAFGPPHGISTMMVAPLLLDYGTDEQRQRWLPGIVTGSEVWCQLFSEPEAGSDLAAVRTRAVRDGEQWIINGQKVWTSGAHAARWGILIARTDPSVSKHSGLSFFGIDMHQPGVEARPLVQITGDAEFNEVFLTGATVPADQMIGDEGAGWAVAMRTLGYERESLDSEAEPGIQYDLDLSQPAGRYASGQLSDGSEGFLPSGMESWELLTAIIRSRGLERDPVTRQAAFHIYSTLRIASWTSQRFAAADEVGAEVSLGKLAATQLMRDWRDLALQCLGPTGQLLNGPDSFDGLPAHIALAVVGMSIAGGTDEIQRNIVGERVLGLPREPQVDRDKPFASPG